MARASGSLPQAKRRRVFRTRRRFGWGWLRRLPLLWLGTLVACAFLVYFFVGSGTFSVRTVRASNLSPADVQAITERCRCLGANIFVVRSDDIKRRLAEGLPTLVVQRVYTRLPNQVVVEAYHKRIVVLWRTPDAVYGVDSTGEVLRVWKRPFPRHWGYPIYDDTERRAHRLLVGQSIVAEPLAMALNLGARLPASLKSQIKGYLYAPFIGFTLRSRTGWWALFGMDYSGALDAHIAALQQALATPGVMPPQGCIDLRGPFPYKRADHLCGR